MAVPADIGTLRAAELLSPRQQQLRELLLMTEEIGSLAEQGEWNEALSRQRDRRLAMEAFFAQACSAEESGLVAQVIQHILTIDDHVSTALANKRNTLSHKQLEHRRKAQNVGRYLSNC